MINTPKLKMFWSCKDTGSLFCSQLEIYANSWLHQNQLEGFCSFFKVCSIGSYGKVILKWNKPSLALTLSHFLSFSHSFPLPLSTFSLQPHWKRRINSRMWTLHRKHCSNILNFSFKVHRSLGPRSRRTYHIRIRSRNLLHRNISF